jgi:DNA-directed RNA polymerase subunit RPC12/RpoP
MLSGWAPSAATESQSYSVACAQGHRLRGDRTEGYQAIRCPMCGLGIFVLPRSPLPQPPQPAVKANAAGPRRDATSWEVEGPVLSDPPLGAYSVGRPPNAANEVEIEWEDEVVEESGPAPEEHPITPSASVPDPTPSVAATTRTTVNDPGASPTEPSRPPHETRVRRARSRQTPPANVTLDQPSNRGKIRVDLPETWTAWAIRRRNVLIFGLVLLMVGGTISLRLRRQRLAELPGIAEAGRIEGLVALDAGDFAKAKPILMRAARAVDEMGGEYEGAEEIRQGAREAALFSDLVPESLETILDEAASRDTQADWEKHFGTLYRGRTIILDAHIAATPAEGTSKAYDLDYRIYFGRGPKPTGRGRVDLSGLQLFELARPKLGDQVRFGARLKSISRDEAKGEWVITLEPESGSFITHESALSTLGWPSDE